MHLESEAAAPTRCEASETGDGEAFRTPPALLLAASLAGLALAGCATGTAASSVPGATNNSQSATPTPEPAPDPSGEWKQTNSRSADSYQTATITGDVLEINWVADYGDTRSHDWPGSFEAPTDSGSFAWDSANDTAKTEFAMLASNDPVKTFSYGDAEISYDVSLLGTTTTVRLGR